MQRQPRQKEKSRKKRKKKKKKKKKKRAQDRYAVGTDSGEEEEEEKNSNFDSLDEGTEIDSLEPEEEEDEDDDDESNGSRNEKKNKQEEHWEDSSPERSSAADSDEEIERVLTIPSDKILRYLLFYGVQAPIMIVLSALLSQHRWHMLVRHRLGGALTVLELSVVRCCVLPPLAALLFPIWWWRNIALRSSWFGILDAPKCRPSNCRLLRLALWLVPVDIVLSSWLFVQLVLEWTSSHDQHMAGGLARIVVLELLLTCASGVAGPVLLVRLQKLAREKPGKRQYSLVARMEEGQGRHHEKSWRASHSTHSRRRGAPSSSQGWDGVAPRWSARQGGAAAAETTEHMRAEGSAAFEAFDDDDERPVITQVLLRPLERSMQKVMPDPSEFEVLWSSSFGSSADLHFRTALTPRLHSVCATLAYHGFHVVAKGQGKIYFAAKETYTGSDDLVATYRAGYTTSRRGYSDDEMSKYSLCLGELRLAKTGMRCDLRCDGPLLLYANEIENLLRMNHHVKGHVEKHGV